MEIASNNCYLTQYLLIKITLDSFIIVNIIQQLLLIYNKLPDLLY